MYADFKHILVYKFYIDDDKILCTLWPNIDICVF